MERVHWTKRVESPPDRVIVWRAQPGAGNPSERVAWEQEYIRADLAQWTAADVERLENDFRRLREWLSYIADATLDPDVVEACALAAKGESAEDHTEDEVS